MILMKKACIRKCKVSLSGKMCSACGRSLKEIKEAGLAAAKNTKTK